MRLMWRIVYPILFLAASALLAIFYPLAVLALCAGAFAILILSRQLNLYRLIMLLKQVGRKIVALRAEIRGRIRLGFKDYNSSISADANEELRHRTHGYIR